MVDFDFQKATHFAQYAVQQGRFALHPTSKLYRKIESLFLYTCGNHKNGYLSTSDMTMQQAGAKIVGVYKLINRFQAMAYEMKKTSMDNASEIMLYHGMSAKRVDILDKESLDLRLVTILSCPSLPLSLSLLHPTHLMQAKEGMLGRGIYGSFYPYYSYFNYTSPTTTKSLFYVKFLIGKCQDNTSFDAQHRRVKPDIGYDSCRMESNGDHIFAIYDNLQCYPCYRIDFTVA